MFVTEAVLHDGQMLLETREVRGRKALAAIVVAELFCSHEGRCDESFCLIAPPEWTYYVGLGWRVSLGALLCKLGQWASCMDHPVVRSTHISPGEAIDFGWTADALFSD